MGRITTGRVNYTAVARISNIGRTPRPPSRFTRYRDSSYNFMRCTDRKNDCVAMPRSSGLVTRSRELRRASSGRELQSLSFSTELARAISALARLHCEGRSSWMAVMAEGEELGSNILHPENGLLTGPLCLASDAAVLAAAPPIRNVLDPEGMAALASDRFLNRETSV